MVTGCSRHDYFNESTSRHNNISSAGDGDGYSYLETPPTSTYLPHFFDNETFYVELSTLGVTQKWMAEENATTNVEVEMCEPLRMVIYLPDHDSAAQYADRDDLVMSRNEFEVKAVYMYCDDYYSSLIYNIYTFHDFDSKPVTIKYGRNTYTLNIKSKMHDMTRYKRVSDDDLNGDFKAFKTMISNIKYHEFTSPYPGRDPNGGYGSMPYWNSYDYHRYFEEEYDTDYVQYLPDSVYYPSKMDLPFEDIGDKSMEIPFFNEPIYDIKKKTPIPMYTVGYGAIDPDCTHPTNVVGSIFFTAVYKDDIKLNLTSGNTQRKTHLYNKFRLLKECYPDQYYFYQLDNGNAIRMIKPNDKQIYGFFDELSYVYILSCTLN